MVVGGGEETQRRGGVEGNGTWSGTLVYLSPKPWEIIFPINKKVMHY
jgi:hypothetical protein